MKLKDQEKEARIRQVTIDIVAEQGIAGVKMATVAQKAAVVPSTLYVYYKNKEALIVSTFKAIVQEMTQEIRLHGKLNQPFRKSLQNMFENAIKYKLERHKEDLFLKMFIASPYFTDEMLEIKRSMEEAAAQLIDYGKQQMIVKENVATTVLVAALDGIIDKLVEYHYKGLLKLDTTTIQDGFTLLWDSLKQ